MRRREFILALGGAAAWPLAGRAQQRDRVRRIAVMMTNAEDDPEGGTRAAAFRQGLAELGWSEGQNLRIDWHWSAGDLGRIRATAAEVAALAPDLVVANGSANLSALKQVRAIPIVFVLINDPVGQGFISSLAKPGGGLIVPPDTYTLVHRGLIVEGVRRHRVPAIYSYRQHVQEGGLMAYGPDTADIFRRSASYIDRILRGANPAELPAQAPTKFEFAINLATAATLGLTVPPTLAALADEVIE